MPYYYAIRLKDFNETYFNDLLKVLNTADKTLNAILMKGKGGYEIFANRPFTVRERLFLYFCTHPLVEAK